MKTKKIVIIGLFAALTYAGTMIHIPLPFLGPKSMIHLGTVVIYLAAVLIGPSAGLAGAIGCAIFDLVLMPVYAIPTFIIKGLQGYAAGKIAFLNGKKGKSKVQNLIGFVVGSIISLTGYFITDGFLYGNFGTALAATIGSIGTSAVGIVFAFIIASAVRPLIKNADLAA